LEGFGHFGKMPENKRLRLVEGESRSPEKPGGNLLPKAPNFYLLKIACQIF